jgi:ankyrin repeat protein
MLVAQDDGGRTPLDIACFKNFKNLALYLLTKYGTPRQVIESPLNVDEMGRHVYHTMLFLGNYDVLATLLNYERVCLRKVIFDEL